MKTASFGFSFFTNKTPKSASEQSIFGHTTPLPPYTGNLIERKNNREETEQCTQTITCPTFIQSPMKSCRSLQSLSISANVSKVVQ